MAKKSAETKLVEIVHEVGLERAFSMLKMIESLTQSKPAPRKKYPVVQEKIVS